MPLWGAVTITIVWLLAVLFWRANRVWLPYYVTGTVGMAFILIFFSAQAPPLQDWLQRAAAWSVHHISPILQIPTETFAGEPGTILVLVIPRALGGRCSKSQWNLRAFWSRACWLAW
jgi:hypothetical protein